MSENIGHGRYMINTELLLQNCYSNMRLCVSKLEKLFLINDFQSVQRI
jgi:hypothetical protein